MADMGFSAIAEVIDADNPGHKLGYLLFSARWAPAMLVLAERAVLGDVFTRITDAIPLDAGQWNVVQSNPTLAALLTSANMKWPSS